MKCLVVSDTHGDAAILQRLATKYQGQVAAFFYCGDSELAADDPIWQTYQPVLGNMDYDPKFPETVTTTVEGQTVFMTHGHLYGVNRDLLKLQLAGEAAKADLVFYGHTHQLAVSEIGKMLLLNPGSISLPGGEFAQIGGTYAIVEATARHFDVQYYDRESQPVSALHFEFDR